MNRLQLPQFLVAACLLCWCARPAAAFPETPAESDKTAIEQAAKEYAAASRRGDAQALAAFWTDDGDLIDESGRAFKGKTLAAAAVARTEEDQSPRPLAITVDSIRFILPEVAIEDGVSEEMGAAASPTHFGRYTAIWVKRGGKWLIDGVRETVVPRVTPHDRLRPLCWMIGNWRDESGAVTMSCGWSPDKNFLLREIRLTSADGRTLDVSQRIGWDPKDRQIKGWTFGSDGGHGQSVWIRENDRWIASNESVMADGASAASVNGYTRVNDDAMIWDSKNSSLDGAPLPDRTLKLVRKPVD